MAASLDYPDARIVEMDHPIAGLGREAVTTKANGAVDAIVAALLHPEGGDAT
ncbi:MAG: hypothetical protein OEM40_06340 [Acidimicrobiia bacterium]|nr:hypothetical protein [Acidimicrobiia bacterium]